MTSLASSIGGRRRLALLLAVASLALVVTPIALRQAKALGPIGTPAMSQVDLPGLPTSDDLKPFLALFPAAPDPSQFDLTKGDQVKSLLSSLPVDVFHPTFKITDQPGYWFDTGFTVAGGRSLAPMLKLPGVPTKATFVIGPDTGAASGHTITWLIRPVGSVPLDEPAAFVGTKDYELTVPGLYAFTCKVHPYMLGAIVLHDPTEAGVSFGKQLVVNMYNGAVVVPSYSDLIFQLVHTFFKATVPSNYQTFLADAPTTWSPQYPTAPIMTHKKDGTNALLPTLDGFFNSYFGEPKTLPPGNSKPAIPGVGEVWIDTQFEKTAGKTKPGTATAVDTETWTVSKKAALPQVNMNNPHNMWTDKAQKVIYQTEWFSDKLDVFDRNTLELIRRITVGNEPSHVMTRTDTDQLHIALNGANGVVELAPGATKIDRFIPTQAPGDPVTHPHAHWMSGDAKYMVTPDPNTDEATLIDIPSGAIIQKPKLSKIPIASSMNSEATKYYIANLLANSISCVSMDVTKPACVDSGHKVVRKTIRLDLNWDLINKPTGPVTLLPIQIPVAPDDSVMLSVGTMSGNIAVLDPKTDNVVKTLPCDPGCHGINYGAKSGGGYYAYVSNKFSNRMIIVDGNPSGNGNPSDAAIVGSLLMTATPSTKMDDTVIDNPGMGGQGVVAIPLVYNGWVATLPDEWKAKLTCKQLHPMDPSAC